MSAFVVVASLVVTVALLPVPGPSVVFAPFSLGLALLALVGVLTGVEDRTVRQRDPAMKPRGWRDNS